MNNNRKKIITYLDDSMTPEEKILFEKELEDSRELRKELLDFRLLAETIKKDAEPSVNESYFINILPEFYSRKSKKKKFTIPRIAYSLTAAAAVILIIFFIFNPLKSSEYTNTNELSINLTDQEMNKTLNGYDNPYSLNDLMNSATPKTDSIVNNMVKDELDLSSATIDKSVVDQYINTDELLDSINDNEANELYSQLINKDIINGARQ